MEDEKIEVSPDDLAEAFKPAKKSKKKAWRIGIFAVGLLTLAAGVLMLVLKLTAKPEIGDAEFLVETGEWALDDEANCGDFVESDDKLMHSEDESANSEATNCLPSVIWKFTEIGKGSLTTNGGANNYDFIWALEDGKLLVETDWLYTLENEYEYKLDKNEGILTLTNDDAETFVFKHNML